jgi:hypothetical protein
MPRRGQAIQRAKKLEAHHKLNGSAMPHDNPSSGMFRFLEAIGADAVDPVE